MAPGDAVQIQQTDRGGMWVYATVITAGETGSFVQIAHPGNLDHGAFKFVPAKNIRTKADLEALAANKELAPPERRALQSQMDWLS